MGNVVLYRQWSGFLVNKQHINQPSRLIWNKLGIHTTTNSQMLMSKLLTSHTSMHGLLHVTLHHWSYRAVLLDRGIGLSAHHLDVSRVSQIGWRSSNAHTPTTHATVSTVSTTTHHWSVVHLHMADPQVLHVQTLRLSVRLQVVQQHQEELARSLRPAALITRSLNRVTLRMATNTSVVASERNSLLVGNHIVQVSLRLQQRHVLDRSTHLASVLEVHGQVRTTGLAAYT